MANEKKAAPFDRIAVIVAALTSLYPIYKDYQQKIITTSGLTFGGLFIVLILLAIFPAPVRKLRLSSVGIMRNLGWLLTKGEGRAELRMIVEQLYGLACGGGHSLDNALYAANQCIQSGRQQPNWHKARSLLENACHHFHARLQDKSELRTIRKLQLANAELQSLFRGFGYFLQEMHENAPAVREKPAYQQFATRYNEAASAYDRLQHLLEAYIGGGHADFDRA